MLAQATPQFGTFHPSHNGGSSFTAPVRLTRKESELLSVLQQNSGRCLSRQYLLATIWGYQNGTKTRTLDVHIQRLRRKLGVDGSTRIMTVLRTGYAWQD